MATITNSSTRNLNEDLAELTTPTQKLSKIMSLLDHTIGTVLLYKDTTYKFVISNDYTYDTDNNIIGVPESIFDTETTAPIFFKIFKALGTMLLKKNVIESPTKISLNELDKHFDFKIKLNVIERQDILREMDICCFAYKMQVCTPSPDKYIIDDDFKTFIKDKNFETHTEATEAFDRYIMIQNLCRDAMSSLGATKDDDNSASAKGLGLSKPKVRDEHMRNVADEVMDELNIRHRLMPFYDQVEYICSVIISKKYKSINNGKDDDANLTEVFMNLDLVARMIMEELDIIREEVLRSKTKRHEDIINALLKLMSRTKGHVAIDRIMINKEIYENTKKIENDVKDNCVGLLSYNDRVRIERERRFYQFREMCGYDTNVTYKKLDKFPRIKQEFEDHLKDDPIVIPNPNEEKNTKNKKKTA